VVGKIALNPKPSQSNRNPYRRRIRCAAMLVTDEVQGIQILGRQPNVNPLLRLLAVINVTPSVRSAHKASNVAPEGGIGETQRNKLIMCCRSRHGSPCAKGRSERHPASDSRQGRLTGCSTPILLLAAHCFCLIKRGGSWVVRYLDTPKHF